MLFVIAATYINGRQAKTEFQVAVRDVQTKIQQVINETKSGYYGSSNVNCSVGGTGALNMSGTGSLGQRGECIFIGKALVAAGDTIYIYPLAGARKLFGSSQAPANAGDARAKVIPNSAETYKLPYGTKLVGAAFGGSSITIGNSPAAFAILTSFSGSGSSSIGSQSFDLHSLRTAGAFAPNQTVDQYEANVNNEVPTGSPYNIAYPQEQRVMLCIQSGGTNQSFILTIGGDSSTTVSTAIKGNTTCAG
jgi:hypothetical protein